MTSRLTVRPPASAPFDRDLDGADITIGRSTTAGLAVPDSSMSRQHVRLFARDGRWWAEDLGTTNGTTLNDAPLKTPTALTDGDQLRMGGTTVQYLAPDAPTPDARRPPAIERGTEPPERQADRLRILNEVHRALATAISLGALLDLILERCFDVLHPEEGVILLKTPDGEWKPAATRRARGTTGDVAISRRIVDEVARKGQPICVLDASMDDRFSYSESVISSGMRSVLAAPLADDQGSLGMISLSSRISVQQFSNQDLDMLVSLASAAALRVRNVELAEEAAERRVLDRELALAHDMQMAMLPRRMPDRPDVDVAARITPAQSVGGDLYDFVFDGDRLWFIVADVSGKGVSAALYMAVARTLFRATVQAGLELAEVLARMNRELCQDNDHVVFTTALVGHLALESGVVTLGDAGHNPALVLGQGGAIPQASVPKCIAFGVVEQAPFSCGTLTLEPGATLVLYTDGVTDARNVAGESFGAERLERAIASAAGQSAAAVLDAVAAAVKRFSAGAPPDDDLTMLALRYRGREAYP